VLLGSVPALSWVIRHLSIDRKGSRAYVRYFVVAQDIERYVENKGGTIEK